MPIEPVPTNEETMFWTVGEVSLLTRVSVRTLHHYDDLGLLSPSERSGANYRLYTPADLSRLHRILTFRELGFPLAEIHNLLDGGPEGEMEALRLQVRLLRERQRQTQATLEAVEAFLHAAERGEGAPIMTNEMINEVFDGFDQSQYEPEVQQRWGGTDAYRQSAERTRRYSKADWEKIKAEGAVLSGRYVALMDAGVPAASPEAAAVAEAHRAYFHKWFYDCSPQMLKGISDLWVNDERFTRNIDKARAGLAAYQHAAVQAWADAQA